MLPAATFFADNSFLLPNLTKMLSATVLIRVRLDKFDNIHIISVSHKIAFLYFSGTLSDMQKIKNDITI